MKKCLILLIILLLFSGCTPVPETDNAIEEGENVTLESLLQKESKHEGLKGIAYNESGGMDYASDLLMLTRAEGKLTFRREIMKGGSTRTYIYEGEENLFDPIEEYVSKYNLSVWDELPESEYFALDAPSRMLTLSFEDGETWIDFDVEFPEGGWPIINSLLSMMKESQLTMELSDGFYSKEDETILCSRDHANTEDEIKELLWGYWRDEVSYIYMDDPQDILVIDFGGAEKRQFRLSQIVNEPYKDLDASWHVIAQNLEDENDVLYISIDKGRLIAEDENGNTFKGSWY